METETIPCINECANECCVVCGSPVLLGNMFCSGLCQQDHAVVMEALGDSQEPLDIAAYAEDEVLSTMTFDLCGFTHVTGQAHPGCAGCGECMVLGTYGILEVS